MRRTLLRAATAVLGLASLTAAGAALAEPSGAASAEFCADPAARCGALLSPACRRLGAGAVSAGCADGFARYRDCLAEMVVACPSAPARPTAGGCSEAEADRAWAIAESRKSCGAYRAFTAACPNSPFVAFAENEIAALGCADPGSSGAEAEADGPPRRPGAIFKECDVCPEMVTLPAGRLRMGSPPNEPGREPNEGPVAEISLAAFALARVETTRGAYARFVAETGRATARCFAYLGEAGFDWSDAADWRAPGYPQTDAHPVSCVSWDDAQAYADWLNRRVSGARYRLPSEAEFEYAARAGAATAYPWGPTAEGICGFANGADQTAAARFPGWRVAGCADGHLFSAPTGAFAPNAFGLHDLVGNLYEWTADCWGGTPAGAPSDGAPRRDGDCAAAPIRGGSWDNAPVALRAAYRQPYRREYRAYFVGFRLARDLD